MKREKTIDYDRFAKLDMEIQLYYSNPENIIEITDKFEKNDLYAFKDITNSIFKR